MKKLPFLALSFLGAVSAASAQTVSTDPVGFVSVSVPAQSDAVISVPLNRAAVFQGMVDSISNPSAGVYTLNLKGSPGFTADQFVYVEGTQRSTYAVQLATGVKEGLIAKVISNTQTSLTIQLDSGENFTGVVGDQTDTIANNNGDQITVMPYWTPGTLVTGVPSGSEMYYFNSPATGQNTPGINLSPSLLMIYSSSTSDWLNQDDELPVTDMPLQFGVALGFRNKTNNAVPIAMVGSVPMASHRFLLKTLAASTRQDVRVGYSSPVPELLSNVTLPVSSGDQLFAYNNAAVGRNKSPYAILIYNGTEWLDTSDEMPVPTFTLQPGWGYVIRLAARTVATTIPWTDTQSYLAP